MTTTPTRASNGKFTAVASSKSDTDWSPLEVVEFNILSDIWKYATQGARTAGESGLVIVQAIPDFYSFLKDSAINPDTGAARSKARKVTKRLHSVVNHLTAAKNDFQQIPRDVTKEFEEEISASRRKNKPKIDWSK